MSNPIPQTVISRAIMALLEEAFESVKGYFLDPKDSLFDTLSGISASEASIPVGGKCATIAAQVAHVNYYMEVLEQYLLTGKDEQADWGKVWRTVREVTPEEWAASQQALKGTYFRLRTYIESHDDWEREDSIANAIALVAHNAYHLGEIRQATCTVKP
jgi:hypothetical protein